MPRGWVALAAVVLAATHLRGASANVGAQLDPPANTRIRGSDAYRSSELAAYGQMSVLEQCQYAACARTSFSLGTPLSEAITPRLLTREPDCRHRYDLVRLLESSCADLNEDDMNKVSLFRVSRCCEACPFRMSAEATVCFALLLLPCVLPR